MGMDRKFSVEAFNEAGLGTEASRLLADDLEEAVQERLHVALVKVVNEIVVDLNQLGHNLEEYMPAVPGDISFRDDGDMGSENACRLRVGVDTVVSAGFGDAKNSATEN